jgi:hypothetical protein
MIVDIPTTTIYLDSFDPTPRLGLVPVGLVSVHATTEPVHASFSPDLSIWAKYIFLPFLLPLTGLRVSILELHHWQQEEGRILVPFLDHVLQVHGPIFVRVCRQDWKDQKGIITYRCFCTIC